MSADNNPYMYDQGLYPEGEKIYTMPKITVSTVSRNRLGNTSNSYQGHFKKVLCVCSAGALRSPTMAWVLSNAPFNFNTRAVGVSQDFAIIPIDLVHVAWADEIITVEQDHYNIVQSMLEELQEKHSTGFATYGHAKLHLWNIPDDYGYREPALVQIITGKAYEIFTPR
jgi:predicted protein tyrosine phosphatase